MNHGCSHQVSCSFSVLENELLPSTFFFVGRAVDTDGPAPTLSSLKACQGEWTQWSRNSGRC
eukprot:2843963-Rhodomonas_salina.1